MKSEDKERSEIDLGVEDEDVTVHVEDRRFWARDDVGVGEDAPPPDRRPTFVQELEERLRKAEAHRDEILAAHRRVQQEFDAARQRLNRDLEARLQRAKASAFSGFLEVVDHMELALQAAEKDHPADDPLVQGVRLIHGQLLSVLRDEGIERIQVEGLPFDPQVAEAVAAVPVDDPASHDLVLRELRPGYRLGELTVRPAQVQVGRCVNPPAGRPQEGTGQES